MTAADTATDAGQAGSQAGQAGSQADQAQRFAGDSDHTTDSSRALQSLAFIGSAHSAAANVRDHPGTMTQINNAQPDRRRSRRLPEPSLGLSDDYPLESTPTPRKPSIVDTDTAASAAATPHPLDSPGFSVSARSIIDRDLDRSGGSQRATGETAGQHLPGVEGPAHRDAPSPVAQEPADIPLRPFSNSLLTSQDFPD